MRFVVLLSIAVLGGCVEVTGAVVAQPLLLATPLTNVSPRFPATKCPEGAVCGDGSAVRAEQAERDARDAPIIAQARQLTTTAAAAAERGDCEQTLAVQRAVLALPDVQLEGGVHDAIFLREPAIVRCLVRERDAQRARMTRDARAAAR